MLTIKTSCPCCGSANLEHFYKVENVPVHSCLLVPDRQTALDFPRRDIQLGFCHDCGFISNLAFDASEHDYSPGYEDQQSFSGTFNRFAGKLAERYVERYNLREKKIVEIGCSKGDFLLLLCELGKNEGVGIDPSCVPGRVQSDSAHRVTFVPELYSEKHAKYQADFICCRHTLEHIWPAAEFVTTVRNAIKPGQNPVVSFELPDVTRILHEQAFWDIYYEHCSYFSPGSLAHLFRTCDFDVVDLQREYGGQYLVIDAVAAKNRQNGCHFELENDLDHLRDAVENFTANCAAKQAAWKTYILGLKEAGKRIAIWGSGSKCVAFLTTLGLEEAPDAIVDINPHRHGKFIPGVGQQIQSPRQLPNINPDVVIIMNPIYEAEISKMLAEMQASAEVRAV